MATTAVIHRVVRASVILRALVAGLKGGVRAVIHARMKCRVDTVVVCAGAFLALAACIFMTHATGEGDSTLHFISARESVSDSWTHMLSSWSRLLFKVLIVGPSWLGMRWARLSMAVLATLLVGQTIGLARDLKLQRPLLAGFFLLAQPFTFFAAQDTLTEIPAALAVYGALRLWMHRHRAWSCFVVSLIPALRPEGHPIIAVWFVLLVLEARRERSWKPLRLAPLLSIGMAGWMAVCWVGVGKPLFPFQTFWPMGGWGYGSGQAWDYLVRFPWFTGSVLFPVFLVGCIKGLRRELTMVWVLWWLVLGLHSFLWWRGLFASAGLLRILVVTAPSTALLCLVGFNQIFGGRLRVVAPVFLIWAALMTCYRYATEPDHQEEKLAWPTAEYIMANHLLPEGTQFFTANGIMLIALDYPKNNFERIPLKYDREKELAVLRALKPGAIGVWDNGSIERWVGVSLADFPELGFEQLAVFTEAVPTENLWRMYRPWKGPDYNVLRYVVFRKLPAENE